MDNKQSQDFPNKRFHHLSVESRDPESAPQTEMLEGNTGRYTYPSSRYSCEIELWFDVAYVCNPIT
jgi:hypothetical protein